MNEVSQSNAPTHETYTPGYSSGAVAFMSRRCAEHQARFALPHLKPGMRLLDIGCGPGTITVGLAAQVTPGEVVGIDMAESQLALARQKAAQQKLQNARFQPGSIYALPFEEGAFDAVFAHAVFEHLKEPVAALQEIRRVLRPEGLVALRSPDWGGFLVHPLTPVLREAMELYQQVQVRNGGDVFAGRKLKDWAEAAGFQNTRWSGTVDFSDDMEGITEFLATQFEAHAGNGDLPHDRALLIKFAEAFRHLRAQRGAIFGGTWGELIAVKGA